MSSTEKRVCADCGAELPETGLASTCSKCLLEACFEEESIYGAPEAAHSFTSSFAAPGEVFGDYELLEEIARGGMGIVFKARQRSLDRIVALKMMLPGWLNSRETVRRFRMEAEAASRLQHPGIVSIHDVGECEGQHFYSMDYIDGADLVRRVKREPIPPELAARWVQSIAGAIHHAHQHGILHRDLKPANVLIDTRGDPHVTDFGLAKLLDDVRDLTSTGHVLGTPGFMPPEQAEPERGGVTVASDVYGLGAILYFLLTGKAPFEGSSMEHTLRLLLTEDPTPPSRRCPGIPRDLETICLKCLSKEPQRRYSSAEDLAEDLGAWARREPIRARPVPAFERLWFWARRNPWLAGLSAGLVVTIIVAVIVQQILLHEAQHMRAAAELALKEQRRATAAAEGLVQYMSEDLTEELKPLGRLPLLENVNETVQRYYEGKLMKETPREPMAGKAQFYRNNALVLRELGRLDEAIESAQSSIGVLEPLLRTEQHKPDVAGALADAHAEMRNILSESDPTAALPHAQEAVQICRRVYDLNPNSEALTRLANAHLEHCSVLRQMQKVDEAAAEIQSASNLLTKASTTGTNATGCEAQLALLSYYQGLIYMDRKQHKEARASFGDYLSRTVEYAKTKGEYGDARVLQDQAIANGHVGTALWEMNDPSEALKYFQEYHRLFENLERLDPGNVNYRRELARSCTWLARAMDRNGDPQEDITPLVVQADDIFEKLANTFPKGDAWQDHAHGAKTQLAMWYAAHSKLQEAQNLLAQEAINRWNRLVRSSDHRANHARFLDALDWCSGQPLVPAPDNPDRVTRLRSWVAQVAAELSKPGAPILWNYTGATLQNRLATALAGQGRFDLAQQELQKALPMWNVLLAKWPGDQPSIVGLAQTYCAMSIAAARDATSEPAVAVKTIRPFLDWIRTVRLSPQSSNQIRDMALFVQREFAKKDSEEPAESRALIKNLNDQIEILNAASLNQQAAVR